MSEPTITTTYLEMLSSGALRAAAIRDTAVSFVELDDSDATRDRLRSLNVQVGAPHNWRTDWVDTNWPVWKTLPHRFFAIQVNSKDIGLFILNLHPDAEVEIRMFGLVPDVIGKGFGGDALTQGTRIAWSTTHPDGATRRVWLHTASIDHQHALDNYLARGFTIYDVVTTQSNQ